MIIPPFSPRSPASPEMKAHEIVLSKPDGDPAQDPIGVRDESADLIYLGSPFNLNASYNVLFKAPIGEHFQARIEA
jgi:hypothetical protein